MRTKDRWSAETRRQDPLQIVRTFISQSRFQQHDRLPPDRDLAEILQLSHAQIRRSMFKLAQEGIVWRHVGRGTFFGRSPDANEQQQRQAELEAESLTNPRELMEARLAIEPPLAQLAAINATNHDFEMLDQAIDGCARTDLPAVFQKHDVDLHLAIACASGNQLLWRFLLVLFSEKNQKVWGSLKKKIITPERTAQYHAHHLEIVAAIKDRAPEVAARAMSHHLSTVRSQLFPQLGGDPG